MKVINFLNRHHYIVIVIEVILVLIFLFLIPKISHAQERQMIHGIIYERDSEMPLAGAHIMLKGTSYGTISGPDGAFRLSISSFPATLHVSHIGYDERFFVVESHFSHDTLLLGMQFSAEMLNAITITDERVELIFRDESYSVLDFEFHENGLMLLIFRNRLKRSELVLLSNMNDTLALLGKLPGKAESLHRDCRDFIHFVSSDSAYQVQFSGDQLLLIHPVPIEVFMPVADAFAAYHHDYYYFAIKRMHKQMVEFIRYDSVSEDYAPFRTVYDSENLRIMKENPEHFGMLASLISDELEFNILQMGNETSAKDQKEVRDMERSMSIESHYLRECVYYPVYAPLFKSEEELILFNHPGSVIEFLTPYGKPIRSTNITHHHMDDWESLILKDEIHNTYYAVYKKLNRVSLRSVDIHSGQLGPPNLLYYPCVKKILVKNGYIYFTYRQPGSIERTMLFRQKINENFSQYSAISN